LPSQPLQKFIAHCNLWLFFTWFSMEIQNNSQFEHKSLRLPLSSPSILNIFGDLPETEELVSFVGLRLQHAYDALVQTPTPSIRIFNTEFDRRGLVNCALDCVLAAEMERLPAIRRLTVLAESAILTPLVVEERQELLLILTGLRQLQRESNPYIALDSPVTVSADCEQPFGLLVRSMQRRYFALLNALKIRESLVDQTVSSLSDSIVSELFAGSFSMLTRSGNALPCIPPLWKCLEADIETLDLIQLNDRTSGSAAAWHAILPSEVAKRILFQRGT
jgi:hypothetical protein